jgi:hypothetical protein
VLRTRESSTSIFEKKEAKKLLPLWGMGDALASSMPQSGKSFCAAFFKKRLLA